MREVWVVEEQPNDTNRDGAILGAHITQGGADCHPIPAYKSQYVKVVRYVPAPSQSDERVPSDTGEVENGA